MKPRRIIVIGASAGGLNALQAVFTKLDANLPATVFAVLHTASDSRYLPGILNRASRLPVKNAENGPIEEGTIYIAAPDFHLMLERDGMHVVKGPKENRHRPSIDVLFRSAALTYRSTVIGVVLTGMLDDGTAGLFYIKRYGGTTVVQDPNDAEFKSMPLNATSHVKVDYIMPLAEIGDLLNRLAKEEITSAGVIASPQEFSVGSAMCQEDERAGKPSLYTCPECQGPLLELRNGDMTRYRCRAGHGYGLKSLTYSQAESTERMLWSALQSLEAKAELEGTMLELAHVKEDPLASEEYRKRHLNSQRAIKLLKDVLELSGGEGTID